MLRLLRSHDFKLIAQNLSVTYQINQRHYQGRHINYYDVLGVKRHADIKEVKVAYFKMAKKFHPDSNKTLDAKQMFELIAEAYDVLSDEDKRKEYDETGSVSESYGGRSAQGPMRQRTDSTYTAEQMYSKIFSSKEGFGERQQEVHQDYAANCLGHEMSRDFIINISAMESICGLKTELPIFIPAVCNKCEGSRSELGYQANVCPYCEGTGQETVKTGHIVGRRQCSYCHGEKLFIKFKCIECEGIGRKIYDIQYPIELPPGCEHGQVLRFDIDSSKIGIREEDGNGDMVIYVTVNVEESQYFTREGMDLSSFIRLSPSISLLGGKLDYNGITKRCDLHIEPCTSSHATMVVNKGGVHSPFHAGDHVLTTLIKVPKKLTWRQKRHFMKFAELETDYLGTIDGVDNPMGHKFEHNVIQAIEIKNKILHRCLFNEDNPSWDEKVIRLIKYWRSIIQRLADPSYRQEFEEARRGDSRNDNRDNRGFGV